MEAIFTPKIEPTSTGFDSIEIKYEHYCDESFSNKLIKIEEGTTQTNNQPFDSIALTELCNQPFDQIFETLSQYLDNFIEVEDFELPPTLQKDKTTEEIVFKSKIEFKDLCSQIIGNLTEDLRKQRIHHSLPSTYLLQVVETTKQHIYSSFKRFKKAFIKALSPEVIKSKQKKIVKKSKYDFPQEAQTVLKSWFVSNFKDPYPSHDEKVQLARKGGISIKQVDNWLINNRGRVWKHAKKNEPKFEKQIANALKKLH